MPNSDSFNGSSEPTTLTTVGNQQTAQFGVRVKVGNQASTQWKVRGLAQSSNKAVFGVDSVCKYMKSTIQQPNEVNRKTVVEQSKTVRGTSVFQNAYIKAEQELNDLKLKLKGAQDNLRQAQANNQASLIARYNLEINTYTDKIEVAIDRRRTILNNQPPGSAFVAHNTYCLVSYQTNVTRRKLL